MNIAIKVLEFALEQSELQKTACGDGINNRIGYEIAEKAIADITKALEVLKSLDDLGKLLKQKK